MEEFRALGWADLKPFAFLGFSGLFVSTGGTYLGIAFTAATSATILQAATPVMVAIGSRLYLKETLRPEQWAGVLCGMLGVLVVVTDGSLRAVLRADLRPGDFILLGSQVGWATYTVYGKRVLATHSPAVATTAAYVLGSLMLLPMVAIAAPYFPSPNLASPVAWAVVAYQAGLGAVAHVWWYEAVHEVGPSRAAMFLNLQPVVGVALAALMLGEAPGWSDAIGGVAVLAGVALVMRPAPGAGSRPGAGR
jgi:drug/metabolite transporter (DMT)-like permease